MRTVALSILMICSVVVGLNGVADMFSRVQIGCNHYDKQLPEIEKRFIVLV